MARQEKTNEQRTTENKQGAGMRILAIDPGKTIGACVLLDGKIVGFGELPGDDLRDFDCMTKGVTVIEGIVPYGSQLSQDVIDTCIQIGELKAIFGDPKIITRPQVKQHLFGTVKGTDSEVRRAMIDRWGDVGTKKAPGPLYGCKGHMFSALAIATVALDQLNGDKGNGKKFAPCFEVSA